MCKFPEFDPDDLERYSIDSRCSKVNEKEFSAVPDSENKNRNWENFFQLFPDILKGKEIKEFISRWQKAREQDEEIIFMFGAHLIKCGLTPLVTRLIKEGWITALASNGASVIHDVELTMFGKTSENVDQAISDGSFGMCKETTDFINNSLKQGEEKELGYGMSVAHQLSRQDEVNEEVSLLLTAYQEDIPYTVHVGLGTDINHPHPSADGGLIGKLSLRDFRILTKKVESLQGGVVINFGSMVILPEVFLKALSAARNTDNDIRDFTTANFDMIQGYRPNQNVVRRPTLEGGKGFSFTGHHELMLPLIYTFLKNF